jgi:hypothetical protein
MASGINDSKKPEMRALPTERKVELLQARDQRTRGKEQSIKEALDSLRHPASFHEKQAQALFQSLRFWDPRRTAQFLEQRGVEEFTHCLDVLLNRIQYVTALHCVCVCVCVCQCVQVVEV